MISGNTEIDLTKNDVAQLTGGRAYVFEVMSSGHWFTIDEVQGEVWRRFNVWFSENCIAARIRDQRKWEYGNHNVNRRARCGRLYEYQLEVRS